MYFLIIVILMQIPDLSPLGSFTTLMALCFVLIVSLVKSGFEDYKRHVSDRGAPLCPLTLILTLTLTPNP